MLYITNAFSLNMLTAFPALPLIREVDLNHVKAAVVDGASSLKAGVVPAIGHADTAAIVDGLLGLVGPGTTFNRVSVTLTPGDVLYVAQYRGPRLPEGTTKLPDGARIDFFQIDLLPPGQVA